MTGPGEVLLGLDVGTTAVKVAAFSTAGGGQVAGAQREYPLTQPRPGWHVQDPATVLAAVDTALAECVAALGATRVAGLAVASAQHGLLGLDERREPVTPLVTWADARSTAEARELRSGGLAADLLRRTGTPVHPMSPLVKLVWFARHDPETAAAVRWWLGLKDLLLLHLTGQLVTELSSASATGLLGSVARDWDADALAVAGIRREQLPPVLPTTTVLELTADAARRSGLPAGLPVVVGAADGPLGNLGTGAIEPGVAGLSLGTSGAVRMAVDGPRADPRGSLFCYALTDDLWVVGGAVSNGGIAMRWAGATFAAELTGKGLTGEEHADSQLLALAAEAPPGSDGLVMLPYLLSERAPVWDPELAGAYFGIRHRHTRQHFLRAALEGVCLQVSTIADALEQVGPVREVRATGGTFRSPLWRTVMAGVLARPLVVEAGAGGTALGATALGWYALGGAADLPSALVALRGPVADPTPVAVTRDDLDTYARLRAGFPALVRSYTAVADAFEVPAAARA
ncbi:gluconate kinase, FGGY family [Friedmanniella luteola]|uniref:Gluconate kinase, FGGY family n=1 Tax=Friedmanniella luteola TaxID=546871 RepID=A0A1H1SFU5_9ACTN|nr:gluconokinase [Friedmanniella luteola]SDS46259.1 gluconate kinase, FGGY family [Friedmanniella luteola]